MKTRSTTGLLLAVLFLVTVSAFLFKYLKKEDYTYYSPAKGQARYNQYLAAERLLSEFGLHVQSLKTIDYSFVYPDPAEQIMIISSTKIYQESKELKAMLDWVKSGGYLIIPAYFSAKNNNELKLLPDLDITFRTIENAHDNIDESLIHTEKYFLNLDHVGIIESNLESLWEIRDDHGVHATSLKMGNGELVIFNSLSVFNNYNISSHDHAKWLIDIITKTNRQSIIHLLSPKQQTVYSLVFAYPALIALLILIIILIIWKQWGYFGPVRNYFLSDQNYFNTHLRYMGQFLWENTETKLLYEATFKEMEVLLLKKHPHWTQKSKQYQIEFLSDLSGLSEKQVTEALSSKSFKNKRQYFEYCKNLTLIRNSL